jgi:hypothetical protein
VVPGAGWTTTDREGRFIVDILRPGDYHCIVRGPDGAEAETDLTVPGAPVDVTLGEKKKLPKAGSKSRS